jgi:hypothetical protein
MWQRSDRQIRFRAHAKNNLELIDGDVVVRFKGK